MYELPRACSLMELDSGAKAGLLTGITTTHSRQGNARPNKT